MDFPCVLRVARLRLPKSLRVTGMFRRFNNSLFMHWRSRRKKPRHQAATNFFTGMNAGHHRHAPRRLRTRPPGFRPSS
jgi:hypothetical protein